MDSTHLHLLITHLPIYGCLCGILVLGYALWKRSDATKMAAYYVFILTAIGGLISYFTGEPAEETAEHLQGVTHEAIEVHEDAAKLSL